MLPTTTHHDPNRAPAQEQALFRVRDFSCAGESAGLERRLRRIAGVSRVTVNPLNETAYVTFDPTRTNLAELEFVVTAAGYRLA